jgi:hypothetical protein
LLLCQRLFQSDRFALAALYNAICIESVKYSYLLVSIHITASRLFLLYKRSNDKKTIIVPSLTCVLVGGKIPDLDLQYRRADRPPLLPQCARHSSKFQIPCFRKPFVPGRGDGDCPHCFLRKGVSARANSFKICGRRHPTRNVVDISRELLIIHTYWVMRWRYSPLS